MVKVELENLSDRIIKTAQELKEQLEKNPQHPNATSLRELGHYCTERFLESQSSTERFLSFFLSSFIDSFFSNLLGDTPYDEELQHAKVSICNKLYETLIILGGEIKKENKVGILDCLSEIVSYYVDKINHLNAEY